jgi:hypothetical protein
MILNVSPGNKFAVPIFGGNMKADKRLAAIMAVPALLALSIVLNAQAVQKPVFAGYKGVMIGTTMDDARSKLGPAKEKSDTEDYYVYGDSETVQVLYGQDKTVRVISINYLTKSAPTAKDVLGIDVQVSPDGGVNKMVKYPKSGFWISYLKTGGDDPMTVVTVQKMLDSEQ